MHSIFIAQKGGCWSGDADGRDSVQSMYFRSTYFVIFLINIICNKLQWSQSQWDGEWRTKIYTLRSQLRVSIYCQLWKIYGFIHASIEAFEFICFFFRLFFFIIYLERNECQKDVSHCQSYLASNVCHRQVISTQNTLWKLFIFHFITIKIMRLLCKMRQQQWSSALKVIAMP